MSRTCMCFSKFSHDSLPIVNTIANLPVAKYAGIGTCRCDQRTYSVRITYLTCITCTCVASIFLLRTETRYSSIMG